MDTYVAIDQGTTSTKAYQWQPDTGGIQCIGVRGHAQIYPARGWVEQDASALLHNIRTLLSLAPARSKVGIANQGESTVIWDGRTKRPLANAIIWQDTRTEDMLARMQAAGIESETLQRAGLRLDSYFSASKMKWLLEHTPEVQELRKKGSLRIGTTDAFFLDALTGHFVTDVSTASRTSLMNLQTCQWDPVLCDIFGIPMECLPQIRPTVSDFGTVSNLPAPDIRIVASCVDQQASLYGHDCKNPNDLKITFGTGAFMLGLTGKQPVLQTESGLIPTVAWQLGEDRPSYALDGGVLTAGSALEWGRKVGVISNFENIGFNGPSCADRGIYFVPSLAGSGAPYWKRNARGTWHGLSLDTTGTDLGQSILEGIALRIEQVCRAFHDVIGGQPGRISIDGGMSTNTGFVKFLANLLHHQIYRPDFSNMTALGMLSLCMQNDRTQHLLTPKWEKIQPERPIPREIGHEFRRIMQNS